MCLACLPCISVSRPHLQRLNTFLPPEQVSRGCISRLPPRLPVWLSLSANWLPSCRLSCFLTGNVLTSLPAGLNSLPSPSSLHALPPAYLSKCRPPHLRACLSTFLSVHLCLVWPPALCSDAFLPTAQALEMRIWFILLSFIASLLPVLLSAQCLPCLVTSFLCHGLPACSVLNVLVCQPE